MSDRGAAYFNLPSDLKGVYARLNERGVNFKGEPQSMGPVMSVLFDNTYDNLINLVLPAA